MTYMAATSILARMPTNTADGARSLILCNADIAPIMSDLRQDALGLQYSALVSLIDALFGIRYGYFSWATIKLYYLCFYAARLLLAVNNCAIFYTGNTNLGKPFSLIVHAGRSPRKESGVTHKIVWSVMERELPSHPLVQNIGLDRAYDWMKSLREEINYCNPRFSDPLVPRHFGRLDTVGIPRAIDSYVLDTQMLYALDPEHAALAFPLECLKRVQHSMTNEQLKLEDLDRNFLIERMENIGISKVAIANLVGV